jgi:hypothetical protein
VIQSPSAAPGHRLDDERSRELDCQQHVVEPVRAAAGDPGRHPSEPTESHQAGEDPHPVEIRFGRRRSIEPGQSVSSEHGTHEAHVGINRRVTAHPGLRRHTADELDRSDGYTGHASEARKNS